jgi:hypothetical protein
MSMSVFNNIRLGLITPGPEAENNRKQLADIATSTKGITIGTGTVSVILGLLLWNIPYIGNVFLIGGGLGALASREIYVMAGNTERMCDDWFAKRAMTARSVDQFANAAFNGTLVAGSLAGPWVKRHLNDTPKDQ